MRKLLTRLIVIQFVILTVVSLASAETCVEPAALVGIWEVVDTNQIFTDKDNALQTVKAMDSGEKSFEAVIGDLQPIIGTTEFADAGGMFLTISAKEANPPMMLHMKMSATWKIECEIMTVQMQSLDELDMAIDKTVVPKDQQEEMQKTIDMLKDTIISGIKDDPNFTAPESATVLFAGKNFLLTENAGNENQILALFKRQ